MQYIDYANNFDFAALEFGGFVVDTRVDVINGRAAHEWAISTPGGRFGRYNLYMDKGDDITTRWYFERKEDAAKFKMVWGWG